MKILIVDLLFTECTRFIDPKNVGGFFCGKDLRHYRIFAVEDCNMQPIEFATSNVLEVQKLVDAYIMNEVSETRIEYFGELKCAIHDFEKSIQSIAQTYYFRVIAPFCEKNKLKFLSGNGNFCFLNIENDETISTYEVEDSLDDVDAPDYAFWVELSEIYRTLNKEIFDGYFGFYV